MIEQDYYESLDTQEVLYLLDSLQNMNGSLLIALIEKLSEEELKIYDYQILNKLNQLNAWSDQQVQEKLYDKFYKMLKDTDDAEKRMSLINSSLQAGKNQNVIELLKFPQFQIYRFTSNQSLIVKKLLNTLLQKQINVDEIQIIQQHDQQFQQLRQKLDQQKVKYQLYKGVIVFSDENQIIVTALKEEFQKNGKPKGELGLLLQSLQMEHTQKKITVTLIDQYNTTLNKSKEETKKEQ